MLWQSSLPSKKPSLPLQVGTEQAALSQDVASHRRRRFLWTGVGFAAVTLIGVSASALLAHVSRASAEPSHLVPEAAFNPLLLGLGPRGIGPASHPTSGRSRPTGLRPSVLPAVKQRHSRSVLRMSDGAGDHKDTDPLGFEAKHETYGYSGEGSHETPPPMSDNSYDYTPENMWQADLDKALVKLDTPPLERLELLQKALRNENLVGDVNEALSMVRDRGFSDAHPDAIEKLWPKGTQSRANLDNLQTLRNLAPEAFEVLLKQVQGPGLDLRTTRPRSDAGSNSDGPQVLVLGGGFGGLYTALRLASLDWSGGLRPRVTLVDRNDRFAFSPMLYELATGTAASWEVAPLYEDLLAGTEIEFVRGEVRALNETGQNVRVSSHSDTGRLLAYDQCILAVGSQPTFSDVPGAAENAQPFYSAADATAVRDKVQQLRKARPDGPTRVSVVGGGYIGVEIAANLGSSMPSSELEITLVHRSNTLLTTATEHSRAVGTQKLSDAGVNVILNTRVSEVSADSLRLEPSGATTMLSREYDLPSDLTLWTAGSVPSGIVSVLDLPTDASGRIAVDSDLSVTGRPFLYALGDAAAVTDADGARSPSTAQAAMQAADYAAWNVRATLRDTKKVPFRYLPLGEMLSLGEDSASISALGQLVKLSGRLGFAGRRAVYAARMPTPRQALKVGVSWGVDAAFAILRKAADLPARKSSGLG